MFNNVHMLRVAGVISHGDDVVDSQRLQRELELGQSAVQRILVTLEGVGLMERLERQVRTEPVRFRRLPHSFWRAAQELADA
ncbi:putative transcriptional regulator [Microbacterium testaceum]|nr:putative transcriptional regulator [Microbacterium sp. SORGH_AS_0969]MDQ1115027.1 putative transcriptional regulator [Microbacterium testaceum]